MDLVVHYECPYAERVLLVKSFKEIECNEIEVDLFHKPDWYLTEVSSGKVPGLRVRGPKKYEWLHESWQICEYLDSFPGPSLYPRNPSSTPDPLIKALIDLQIKTQIEPFCDSVYKFLNTGKGLKSTKTFLQSLNNYYFKGGKFYMNQILKSNELTIADIMLFPFIERVWALKSTVFSSLELDNVWSWFLNLSKQNWTKVCRANPGALRVYNS